MLPLLLYEAAWLFLFQQRELDMKKRKLDEGNIGLALKIFLLGKGCKDKAISNKVTRRQMFSRSVHRPVRSAPLLVKYLNCARSLTFPPQRTQVPQSPYQHQSD